MSFVPRLTVTTLILISHFQYINIVWHLKTQWSQGNVNANERQSGVLFTLGKQSAASWKNWTDNKQKPKQGLILFKIESHVDRDERCCLATSVSDLTSPTAEEQVRKLVGLYNT